jgi:hypothetical protein
MADTDEIVQTVERLHKEFADLAIRGLRSSGPEHLSALSALREEFERIGADHLAGRIAAVTDALRSGASSAAPALLRAQASLHVFERLLTLEAAAEALGGLVPEEGEGV